MPNGWKYKSFDFNGLTKGFEDGGLTRISLWLAFGKAGLAAQDKRRICGAGPSTSLRFAQDDNDGGRSAKVWLPALVMMHIDK
jgi:hypothetical protein